MRLTSIDPAVVAGDGEPDGDEAGRTAGRADSALCQGEILVGLRP